MCVDGRYIRTEHYAQFSEPKFAWRAFNVNDKGELTGVFQTKTVYSAKPEKIFRSSMKAHHGPLILNGSNSSIGFHAVRSRKGAAKLFLGRIAIGKVRLLGYVHEYTHGFLAERMQIVAVEGVPGLDPSYPRLK